MTRAELTEQALGLIRDRLPRFCPASTARALRSRTTVASMVGMMCDRLEAFRPEDIPKVPEMLASQVGAHADRDWPGTDAYVDHTIRAWYRDLGGSQGERDGKAAVPPGGGAAPRAATPPAGAPGPGPGPRDAPPEGGSGGGATVDDLKEMLRMGLDVALVGPAGCGKTRMAMEAAAGSGRPFTIVTAPQMPHEIAGFTDAQGRRVDTPFTEAYLKGKLVCIDEADRASEDALIALHAPVANRTMWLQGLGQTQAAEGFQVIMTMNTWGDGADDDYVTARLLDSATRDRFVFLRVGFDPGVDEEMAGGDGDLLLFAREWRAAVEETETPRAVLSYRGLAALKALEPVVGREEALRRALVKGLRPETLGDLMALMPSDTPWHRALRAVMEDP